MRPPVLLALAVLLMSLAPSSGSAAGPGAEGPFPPSAGAWKAAAPPASFDRKTVYDELDGGAEVYLEYGLKALRVQKYAGPGDVGITFDLFEMEGPAGAYGAFTFEQEDEDAGIGQGSEYGGGLLRFWRGRWFGFVQAERETAASKDAVLELGRAVASKLGFEGKPPALAGVLPSKDMRPLSVRYVLSPLVLSILDPRMQGNPMGLPARCEAVLARYGAKGSPERVMVARFTDPASAGKGLERLLAARFPKGAKAAEAAKEEGTFVAAQRLGSFVIVVTGAPDALGALKRLESTMHGVEEVAP